MEPLARDVSEQEKPFRSTYISCTRVRSPFRKRSLSLGIKRIFTPMWLSAGMRALLYTSISRYALKLESRNTAHYELYAKQGNVKIDTHHSPRILVSCWSSGGMLGWAATAAAAAAATPPPCWLTTDFFSSTPTTCGAERCGAIIIIVALNSFLPSSLSSFLPLKMRICMYILVAHFFSSLSLSLFFLFFFLPFDVTRTSSSPRLLHFSLHSPSSSSFSLYRTAIYICKTGTAGGASSALYIVYIVIIRHSLCLL